MYFLFSHLLSELLILLLVNSLVFHSFEELLDVLQVILAGVVRVEVSVKVGDGSLGL